jgi:hypothetical protein
VQGLVVAFMGVETKGLALEQVNAEVIAEPVPAE